MDSIILIIAGGLAGLIGEMLFFRSYAPNDPAEMKSFIAREKGKAAIGVIGCVGLLVYFAVTGEDIAKALAGILFSIGMFAWAQWKQKQYKVGG